MFLTDLDDGDLAVIENIPDGDAGKKLSELGICTGSELEKITGSPLGNIVTVEINGNFYAITNDIAEKMLVRIK